MTLPLVSVLIPCHNADQFVGEAIRSLLDQDYPNVEVIVVDDDSSDRSAEVVENFGDCVQLIKARCGSAAKARNVAARFASGELLKFFDADDILDPQSISDQVRSLNGRKDAVASAKWGRFYSSLDTFQLNPESVWCDMDSREWLVETWRDARPMMQPGIFLIPREVFVEAGDWDESLTLIDDFEFFSRVLCCCDQVRFAEKALLYYRSNVANSLSRRKDNLAVESAYRSLITGTSHLLAKRDDREARLACANLLQDFVYTYYPEHSTLRSLAKRRVKELGGSDLQPDGPPRFQQLRKWIGWKAARRLQRLAGR